MSKTLLLAVGEEIAALENEIFEYRMTKLKNLAPSAFSYQLYSVKLGTMRTEWEQFKKLVNEMPELNNERDAVRDRLESLLYERMAEVKRQNEIHLEDYPENEEMKRMKKRHDFLMGSLYRVELRGIGIAGWNIFEEKQDL